MSIIINNLFLLNDLADDEKREIISRLNHTVKFKKGDVIYSAEQFNNSIGFVLSGKAVAVTNNSDGVIMKTFTAGNTFGVAALFGNEKEYISTIIAKNDMKILFITEEELKSIFADFPKTAINYITFLSDRVRFLNNKLNIISCNSAEDTVFKYLNNIKNSDNTVIIPVNMSQLSKMLGVGRATLYRSFDSLEKEGRIKRENNIIKVIENEKNC